MVQKDTSYSLRHFSINKNEISCFVIRTKILLLPNSKSFKFKLNMFVSKRCSILVITLLFCVFAFAQQNMTLISQTNFVDQGKGIGNDIWGYVAPDGHEYAIVGTTMGTLIYDLEDPTAPVEIGFIEGSNSTWRDMKHWGTFVYVTTDSGTDGLLIIDMANAPSSIEHKFIKPVVKDAQGSDVELNRCHNIFIDENGIIYLSGCQDRGVEFLDPNVDPWNPKVLGSIIGPYHHDSYASGDTLYASQLAEDFAIYDVKDKSNPILLGTIETSKDFTHNIWVSKNGQYAFTTDEVAYGNLDAYDVSDPENIVFLDSWRPEDPTNAGIIPHNTHWYNGYLVTSWYTSGVIILDGNKPDNLVKVAEYDTFEGPDGNFNGCWGATPYLPSGILLANDRQSGFYIFDVNYQRACYLEGTVTDVISGNTIPNVSLTFDDPSIPSSSTAATGKYKEGRVDTGAILVTYSKSGYFDKTVEYDLKSGEVTIGDVALTPKETFECVVAVFDEITQEPLPNASIFLKSDEFEYNFFTDNNGQIKEQIYGGDYTFYVGKWSYQEVKSDVQSIGGSTAHTFYLSKGYYDSYVLDLGWTVESTATTGLWERGVPNGTFFSGITINPDKDVSTDFGEKCFVTGNAKTSEIGEDDVDNGYTKLRSPAIQLDPTSSYQMSAYVWFHNDYGTNEVNDKMEINVITSSGTKLLKTIDENTLGWKYIEIPLSADDIDFKESFVIEISVEDEDPGHILEAGVDVFNIETIVATNNTSSNSSVHVYPNPASDMILVQSDVSLNSIEIYSSTGQLLESIQDINQNNFEVKLNSISSSGLYVAKVVLENNNVQTVKFQVTK